MASCLFLGGQLTLPLQIFVWNGGGGLFRSIQTLVAEHSSGTLVEHFFSMGQDLDKTCSERFSGTLLEYFRSRGVAQGGCLRGQTLSGGGGKKWGAPGAGSGGAGTLLEHFWNTFGTLLEHSWNTLGQSPRNTFGILFGEGKSVPEVF